MSLGIALGLVGAVLSIIAYTMKSMLPLRAVLLISNVCFLVYGIMESQLPSILLNLIVIPLNFIRFREIQQLVQQVEAAKSDAWIQDSLLSQMSRRDIKAGQILFNKGESAHEMFYIQQGNVHLKEANIDLGPGDCLGEIGIFATDGRRTQSAYCTEDTQLFTLSKAEALQLYYQDPKVGFHLMRLIVDRLQRDSARERSNGQVDLIGATR